jgi:hypothetical protein
VQRERQALLLWIICGVCEYSRIKSTCNAITTFNHDTVFIGIQEFVVEDNLPLSVNTLPATVTGELWLELLRTTMLICEILERVGKLENELARGNRVRKHD